MVYQLKVLKKRNKGIKVQNSIIHECLSDGGMDPSDINNAMSAFSRPRLETHLKNHEEKSTPIKNMGLLEQINLPTTWLIGEAMKA